MKEDDSDRIIGKFENVYFWIAKLLNIKNIKFVCNDIRLENLDPKHKPINSWFLRLINLDKKVLTFNLKKKFGLVKSQKKKIYIYNQNTVIREIEPYLYDKGISYEYIPDINFKNYKNNFNIDEEKLLEIINFSFENNFIENKFKIVIFEIYKKLIKRFLEKEVFTEKLISKLDKSNSLVVTNAFENTFASLILSKQLQQNNFKIIEVFHGLTKSFLTKTNIKIYETDIVDMVLCHSKSEEKLFKEYDPNSNIKSISTIQETKKLRLKKFQRFYVNKMINLSDRKRILYPSIIYPYNNVNEYGERPNDRDNYNFEKRIISSLSKTNKEVIYKTYPNRCFIDENTLIKFAENLNNLKVISGKYDLRYISCIGDIFILAPFAGSSTVMWLLGLNKPIIYLNNPKFQSFNENALSIIRKIFITVDIKNNSWENDLINLLNQPYNKIEEKWKSKNIYRDEYDEEWLLGTKLHAGKLGAKYIDEFMRKQIT